MINRLPYNMERTRALFAITGSLSAIALAGCGGERIASDQQKVETCGKKSHNMASKRSLTSSEHAITTASKNVIILKERALSAGGSIDLRRYNGTTEIEGTPKNLTLNFLREVDFGATVEDEVTFPINNGEPKISIGSIACFNQNDELVPNTTYEALEQYVNQTTALER